MPVTSSAVLSSRKMDYLLRVALNHQTICNCNGASPPQPYFLKKVERGRLTGWFSASPYLHALLRGSEPAGNMQA